jgi:hypothetical protein
MEFAEINTDGKEKVISVPADSGGRVAKKPSAGFGIRPCRITGFLSENTL